jgi:tetratricopeptide (TPR) repeat protein
MSDLVGTALGQYQIVELIGEGGMAAVYKAWQPTLRRYVALKVLTPDLAGDAEFVKRFHQEAVAAANLKQTNIVTIHDVGVEGDYHYIAMELIEGTSLAERVRSGPTLTPEQVVDIITQVGAALDYAHERGFVHRDVKPANILVDASGRVVLTDFGLVKALSGSGVTSTLTRAGTVFGTPRYMSPEQIKDEPLDYRSDLYSLGIVCYEMLSGQVPFDSTTTHSVLYAQVNTPPPPLRDMAGLAVPPPVEAVVERMLAKARENRYQSAGQFARDLAQAVAGIWPARLGGARAALPEMESDTTSIGGTPEEMPAATVRQLAQPATPPVSAPVRRRSRWPLLAGVAAAVGILLIVGTVVGVLVLGKWYVRRGAQAALASGDYVKAAQGFSQILESDPGSTEAVEGLLEAAAGLARAGQFDDAILAYEAVWQARPNDVLALRGLGQAHEAQGEWGKAAGWYEQWTQAQPQDRSAFLALGRVRYRLGEYERAVAAYGRAEALGADSAEMGVGAGLAYFELSRYDKAVEYLQDEIGQNAESFEAQRALGVSLFAQGQPAQAVAHLNAAITLGASRPGGELMDVYYALSGSFFAEQDYEQAIRFYEQAREIDPDGEAVWAHEAQANLNEVYSRLAQSVLKDALLDLDFSNIVTEGGETYAIAQGGQEAKVEGPVRVMDGPWAGSRALVMEEGTTNECSDPSFETETTNWVPASAGSIARSQDDAWMGAASLRCSSGGGQGYATARYLGGVGSFDARVDYALSASYKLESMSAGGNVAFGAYWIGGANPDAYAQQAVGASEGSGWHRVSAVMTPDHDDRTGVHFYFVIAGATADEQSFLLDAFQIEQDHAYATSYADGSLGDRYGWLGRPHASASARLGTWATVPTTGTISTSEGTIVMWFRFIGQETSHIRGLWSNHTASDNMLQLFACWPNSGDMTLFKRTGVGNEVLASATMAVDDKWHQLVWTWNSESRLYIDGSLAATYSGDAWNDVALASDMYLGREVYNPPAYLNGAVSRFATFDHALTASEVTSLHEVGVPVSR